MLNLVKITSRDNPLIKSVIALQSSAKARREHKKFVLEGYRICDDARLNGIRFDKLIISDSFFEKFNDEMPAFAENSDGLCLIPDSLFVKISDTENPQGILAIANTPQNPPKLTNSGRFIALENLNDPANLGAIARTAEALGVSGIILNSGVDPYSPKCLRASMGTLLRLPLIFTDDLISFFKQNSLRSFACVVEEGAQNIGEIKFADGDVIIIGNEANGITAATANSSYKSVTIPMSGAAESLNAAAAAAIAMWELVK